METRIRSLTKAITYRVLATVSTAALGYIFTNDVSAAVQIGLLDFGIKLALFYFNDRAWIKVKWGTNAEVLERKKRIDRIRKVR